jgi:hypothetical protein
LYRKTKEEVNVTAGPEFGTKLHGKILIIYNLLYGLKTSAARFSENVAESPVRLRFKKTKHDPVLWMIHKSRHSCIE